MHFVTESGSHVIPAIQDYACLKKVPKSLSTFSDAKASTIADYGQAVTSKDIFDLSQYPKNGYVSCELQSGAMMTLKTGSDLYCRPLKRRFANEECGSNVSVNSYSLMFVLLPL